MTTSRDVDAAFGLLLALTLTGCGSPTATAPPSPAVVTDSAAKPSPAPSRCGLTPGGEDLIAWYRTPGNADDAQILGSVDFSQCTPTADTFAQVAPTSPGYCSVLARSADNPGYNTQQTPAVRPRKALVEAGPAC